MQGCCMQSAYCDCAMIQFPPLTFLQKVDVSHNLLTTISAKAFLNLGHSVKTVDLRGNLLVTLHGQLFLPLYKVQVEILLFLYFSKEMLEKKLIQIIFISKVQFLLCHKSFHIYWTNLEINCRHLLILFSVFLNKAANEMRSREGYN